MKAEVVELADTHGSEPCTRKGVGVQVSPSALSNPVPRLLLEWENKDSTIIYCVYPLFT